MTGGTGRRGGRRGRRPRPIHELLDLLGQKWTLRILWELSEAGPLKFRELRDRCNDVSPSLLNSRLRTLREKGLVALQRPEGYFLTKSASELASPMLELEDWARRWQRRRVNRASRLARLKP